MLTLYLLSPIHNTFHQQFKNQKMKILRKLLITFAVILLIPAIIAIGYYPDKWATNCLYPRLHTDYFSNFLAGCFVVLLLILIIKYFLWLFD